jgi:hypothetical protein
MTISIDIGHGHTAHPVGWHSDRDLNPQHEGISDVDLWGIDIEHPFPEGAKCFGHGAVTFDGPTQRLIAPAVAKWTLNSDDPLDLSPSVLCRLCGDHGFIRQGRWVPA